MMTKKALIAIFYTLIFSCFVSSCISGKKSEDTASNTKTLDSKAFAVKYPINWYIDTLDEDYVADKLFSINTDSGQNYIAFYIFDEPINIEDHINAQIETNKELVMRDGQLSNFSSWGKYNGKGAMLTGTFFSTYPGKIKVFAYSTAKKGFLIFQQVYNEDEGKNKEGFDLIENSFELK